MACRLLNTRLIQANLSGKVCVTSNASMSSSSSSTLKPKNTTPKNVTPKRESIKSMLSSVLGFGYMDPADPNDEPIRVRDVRTPHSTEIATGERKLLLLAFENGFLDPYCNLPVESQGRGTKDNPIPIEGFGNERLVACACEDTQNHFKYTWVHRGEPKRCQCGHWLEFRDAPRFWEKIPKEDLLEIPFFADLEEKGQLDDLLAGKWSEDLPVKELKDGPKGH